MFLRNYRQPDTPCWTGSLLLTCVKHLRKKKKSSWTEINQPTKRKISCKIEHETLVFDDGCSCSGTDSQETVWPAQKCLYGIKIPHYIEGNLHKYLQELKPKFAVQPAYVCHVRVWNIPCWVFNYSQYVSVFHSNLGEKISTAKKVPLQHHHHMT